MQDSVKYLAIAAAVALGAPLPAANAETVLNVASGGSQNMVEYVTDYLGSLFESENPGVKVNVLGTGPGDAGSQKILEKLMAQKDAGLEEWDIDVVVGNQLKTAEMVNDGLLASYRDQISNS
ncbi:MAG: ABC transporter substrate-binding protein, partial [Halocynthiibacter sp.]